MTIPVAIGRPELNLVIAAAACGIPPNDRATALAALYLLKHEVMPGADPDLRARLEPAEKVLGDAYAKNAGEEIIRHHARSILALVDREDGGDRDAVRALAVAMCLAEEAYIRVTADGDAARHAMGMAFLRSLAGEGPA